MEDVAVHLRDAVAALAGIEAALVDAAVTTDDAGHREAAERGLDGRRADVGASTGAARCVAREIAAGELEIMREPREEALGEGMDPNAAARGVEDEIGHRPSILGSGMRTLYGLSQSPWTEKARWALDHHTIAYRYHEHVPVLGELLLRAKARSRPKGTKPSVPLLTDGDAVFCSSIAIARHAESLGRGDPLFAKESDDAVLRWVELSDRVMCAGRARVLAGLRMNGAAQREALPPFIPAVLRGVLAPMATTAALFLGSKYEVGRDPDAEAEAVLRPAFEELRAVLGGRPYLLERFTFADIAMAASLQTLRARKRAPIGPATREIWENVALARDFEDLLTWRDGLYARHRPGI
jgi:glutathione S-transferase